MGSWQRRFVALTIAVAPSGCGPEIPFTWQVVDVLDLGMQVEVEELGPLGDPGDPMGRSFHDAMPLDRVRASVMVADVTGPVPPESMSFAWFACPGTRCLETAPSAPCPDDGVRLDGECSLGIGDVARFEFADIEDAADLVALSLGATVTVRAIGGLEADGGAQACLERLERDADLGACMIVESYYPLGSVMELADLAESRGGVIDETLLPDTARQFPRNRVPAIEDIVVVRSSGAREQVVAGGNFSATVGEPLDIIWEPTQADREEVAIVGSEGTMLDFIDPLVTSWWTTQRASEFDFVPGTPRVRWVVGPDEGTFVLYVVVTDGSNANGWTSFDVEVTR